MQPESCDDVAAQDDKGANSMARHTLNGKVAVVTGASRGIGKGIALALGEAGAMVYITGRSTRGHGITVPMKGAITIDDTAEEISRRGGIAVAVRCDHRDDAQTEALFERVRAEQGRLDLLVNSAWMGYEGYFSDNEEDEFPPDHPFWQRQLSWWDQNMFGPRAAYIASYYGARIMVERGGLIVHISHYPGYNGPVAYHVSKAATDHMALEMAAQLRPHNVAVVSLYPGLVRTEGVLKNAKYFDMTNSESPEYIGRGIVALASDPDVMNKTGSNLWGYDLAKEYNFTDVDGSQPKPDWYASV
jgi:dehydrogenase/reductase SDR family member 1